jgi:hypothetical protein
MFQSAYNLSFLGSPNHGAYFAPNHSAYSAPNHAAYFAPNHAAYVAPNHAAYAGPNHAAYSGPNHAAYAGPNHAAYGAPNHAAYMHPVTAPMLVAAVGTGAGSASGTGFLGGYGPIARFEYATPVALGPLPWVLDFATGDGWPSFPLAQQLDPISLGLEWLPQDWDPALRFWTRPFDLQLTEWLQDLNLAAPAVMAAREFAARHEEWRAPGSPMHDDFKSDRSLFLWQTDWPSIQRELTDLADLMRDDRLRYLDELAMQSSQMIPYFVHLMGFDPATKPWTMELMNCATALGNLVKMHYKSFYRRVRPSTLCPGLTPPWGPPRHPAFPSGHSTVAHLIALLLLSVPGIAQRFGILDPGAPSDDRMPRWQQMNDTPYGADQKCALLWLAWRIARGRERLGLHYRTDSAAGRRLAALVWDRCVNQQVIAVPALMEVLAHAKAEWPLASAS